MRSLALLCLSLTHLPTMAAPNNAQCAQATFDSALAQHGAQGAQSPDLQRRVDRLKATLDKCTDLPQVPPSCLTPQDATAAHVWSAASSDVRVAAGLVQQHAALPSNALDQVTWHNKLLAAKNERRTSIAAEQAYEPLNNRPVIEIDEDIATAKARIDALQADRRARASAEAGLLDLRTTFADVSAAWNRSRCRIVQCTANASNIAPQQLDPACPGVGHARSAALIAELRQAATEIDEIITSNAIKYDFDAIAKRLEPSFQRRGTGPDVPASRVLAQAAQGPARPMSSLRALWDFVRATDGLQRLTPEQRRYVAYAKPWIARWRRAEARHRALLEQYEAGWHLVGAATMNPGEAATEPYREAMRHQAELARDLNELRLEPLATFQEFL